MNAAIRGARRSIVDLLEGFVRQQAPAPLRRMIRVLRTTEREQADAMIFGVPSGASGDDDVIAGFQRLAVDFAGQLRGRGPLDDVSRLRPVFFHDIDVDERVWVAEDKLNELALDGDRLVLDVRGRE